MMARKLGSLDLQILKKLAPELADSTCGHAGWEFRSVLPPLSQHEHVNALVEVVGTRISKLKATELLQLYKFAGD